MFDVDPKWAELVKERGNLPHDLQKRLPGNERGGVNKGKSPGRPPMMPSPTSQQSANSANLVATSMASGLNFPLGNLNNSLLSGLSLGNFDPKNNPLLMPFGGLTNLGALSGLGNLGNLGSMGLTNSLFANLAGLSLPSLAGMEAALNAQVATSSAAAVDAVNNPIVSSAGGSKSGGAGSSSGLNSSGGGGGSSSSKSRSNKLDQPTTTGKSSAAAGGPSTLSAASSATSLPTPSPFPFFLSNPSLLYTPLGLGGLNPFSMQPGGVSSAYESLAQCGLLNPPTSSASSVVRKPASSSGGSSRQREAVPESSSSSSSSSSTAAKRKEAEKKASRYPPVDPAVTLQQYTDMAALHSGEDRRGRSVEQQQQQHEKREMATTEQIDVMAADLSEKKTERRSKEQEMKEALEHLSRTSAELVTRTVDDAPKLEKPPRNRSNNTDGNNQNSDHQRSTLSAPPPLEVTLEPVAKKMRTEVDTSSKSSSSNNDVPTIEIEPATRQTLPTTPTKAAQLPPSQDENNTSSVETNTAIKKEVNETATTPTTSTSAANTMSPLTTQKSEAGNKPTASEVEEDGKGGPKAKKARSGKRLNVEPPPERKNLRSSAGRQARAAAERQARMEGEMQQQHSEQQQQQDSHVAGE